LHCTSEAVELNSLVLSAVEAVVYTALFWLFNLLEHVCVISKQLLSLLNYTNSSLYSFQYVKNINENFRNMTDLVGQIQFYFVARYVCYIMTFCTLTV